MVCGRSSVSTVAWTRVSVNGPIIIVKNRRGGWTEGRWGFRDADFEGVWY